MQHARQYHTTKLEKAPGMPVSPEDRHQSLPYFSFLFLNCIALPSQTQKKNEYKFAFQNSLMQDADEHYFNVGQPHDRMIECVRKKDSIAYSQL